MISRSSLIEASVTVEESAILTVCYRKVQLTKVGDFVLPNEVQDTRVLEEFLDMTSKLQESAPNTEDVLKATTTLLDILGDKISCEKFDTIKHLKEQLFFIITRNPRYSSQMMVLSCLLCTFYPHVYKLLRHSGVLLPHPVTDRKCWSSRDFSPQTELDDNFLSYMKQRMEHLNPHERGVTLMVDEIHIKSFVNYRVGNVCGSAFNTSEAATSAHVFMVQRSGSGTYSACQETGWRYATCHDTEGHSRTGGPGIRSNLCSKR